MSFKIDLKLVRDILTSAFSPLPRPRLMAALLSLLVGGRGGGFPGVAPAGPRSRQPMLPPVSLPRRFLACPMATPSACLRSSPSLPWSFRPPPSPRPSPPHSRRSTCRSRLCSPLVRPLSAPPCLRFCSPMCRGPVTLTLPPPSSSPSRLSSAPYLPRRTAVPKRPLSVLLLLLVSPPPPAGPCGRSPRPSPSFPWT